MTRTGRPVVPLVLATVVAVALAGCSGASSAGSGTGTTGPATSATSPAPTPAATTPAATTPAATDTAPGTATGTPTPSADLGQLVEVTVAGGKVSGPRGRVKVKLGSRVTLRVTSDVADEVHLHGYDKHADVAKGGTADLTFTADVPGVFEVELESRALQLVQLQVQ